MISQGFHIGDRDWYVMCQYDVRTEKDLAEVYKALMAAGCPDYQAREACMALSRRNTGYTFTNFEDHLTIMVIGESLDPSQLYDTCQHEIKHATEHIGEFYGVDPGSEESAYLQGEIARNMFPAVSILFCPHCGKINVAND